MKNSNVLAEGMYVVVDENGKFVHEHSIMKIDNEYTYLTYDRPERSYPKHRITEVLETIELHNKLGNLGHTFTIKPINDKSEICDDIDDLEQQFDILNNFQTDKVTITANVNGFTVVKTYKSFEWETDADYLLLGDKNAEQENLMQINYYEILEVVEENEYIIKIQLVNGEIIIVLDSDYSRCSECHTARPTHYIRVIGEETEEYDIKLCQDCLNKKLFGE